MPNLSLFPKEKKFFAFFEQQAGNVVQMAQQLKDMIYIWENVKERTEVLADMEQDGDAIKHDISTLLARTFIPPFDREDITALAHSLDAIADRIHGAADTMFLYNVERPGARAREFSDILMGAVTEVEKSVAEINIKINQEALLKRCMAINQFENTGDFIYRQSMVELFENPGDMGAVVKWREIYKKLEAAIDACESFAKILEGIAIKYG